MSWLQHQMPWQFQPAPFPSLGPFVTAPDLRLGSLWQVYYLLTFLWAWLARSPRQMRASTVQWEQEQEVEEWSLSAYTWPARQQEAPLSHAWPGELKHQLVERCYEHFRAAQ